MANDAELLRDYAEAHNEAAFHALVERHINLVYCVALRQVGGNAHLAQDVAQRVFVDLARKAKALSGRATLGGWLYRAAQFTASDLVRAERARRNREQEAHLMEELADDPSGAADWQKLRPVLDAAISELAEPERDAVVLRFFEARPFAQIGATLRVTEDAARMRVERALEKLRLALSRRGVTSTSAALAAVLSNQVSSAVPTGLVASVTGAALAGSATGTNAVVIFMGMTKAQVGIVAAVAAAFSSVYAVQGGTNARLRDEIAAIAPSASTIAAARAENRELARTTAEVETLRHDDAELKQLERRIAEMRKVNEERVQVAKAQTQARQRFYAQISADDARNQQEIERMNREGNALVIEYKELEARSKDAAQTPDVRAAADMAAKAIIEAIKTKQQEIRAFMQNTGAARAQRLEAFRRVYGDDPNMPPPPAQSGMGRSEFRRVPVEGKIQATNEMPPHN